MTATAMRCQLISRWRDEADLFRRRGLSQSADLVDSLADDLIDWLGAAGAEQVGLQRAAQLSGYSTRSLRRMVAEGKLTNIGSRGKPRFCVSDLPRKLRPPGAGDTESSEPAVASEFIAGVIGRG